MSIKNKILKNFKAEEHEKYSEIDLQYMSSLSSAVLQKSIQSTKILTWSLCGLVFLMFIWAAFAEVDEQTKGMGKIIPISQIQKIQNLEGGIVEQILVAEGDMVEKNQTIVKLSSTGFSSSAAESKTKLFELRAKSERLAAELDEKDYRPSAELLKEIPSIIRQEQSIYLTDLQQYMTAVSIATEQLKQAQNELNEALAKQGQLEKKYELMDREIKITQPLIKKGLVSEVEFLRTQRQAGEIDQELSTISTSLPRIKSKIAESGNKLKQAKLEFKNKTAKELNEVNAELARLTHTQVGLEDKVDRATIRAPLKGTVKKIYVTTVGGVIQPGSDIIDIVPAQDVLISEIKVKPADIAFIRPEQAAMVKFSAYDFSVHGGLKGKVIWVSADTIRDEKGESFYLVRVKTDKSYLGSEKKKLEIMVGMTVEVDILTGKKTVLSYLLKPILKAKSNALSER